MRILYISSPSFFDMDLSFIQKLSNKVDLFFLLDVPICERTSSSLNICDKNIRCGIYKAKTYIELDEFEEYINIDKTFVIHRTSKKNYSFSNVKLQFKIKRLIDEINPDIIHCNNFLGINFLALLICRNILKIQTIHDPFPHMGDRSAKAHLLRKMNYFFIKNKILLNEVQRSEFIKKNKFQEKHIFQSNLGIYSYLNLYNKSNIYNNRDNTILFFGRITLYKGIEFLISAVNLLQNIIPDLKLIIAGKGEYYFDQSLLKDNKNIQLINRHITNAELVSLIKDSKFVVCPYTEASQSGVIMTSFALNTPVIATDVGGLSEMITNNRTGLLVPSKSVKALSEAISKLIMNNDLLQNMKINIYNDFYQGERSWEQIAEKTLQIYNHILSTENES
jgi:glycosyltransferase involved in cell wall biosynthesis